MDNEAVASLLCLGLANAQSQAKFQESRQCAFLRVSGATICSYFGGNHLLATYSRLFEGFERLHEQKWTETTNESTYLVNRP